MKKTTTLIIAILLLTLTTTQALAIKVECDKGKYNTDICRDFELQDEFDQIEDYIKSLEKENRQQWIHIYNGKKIIKILKKDQAKLEKEIMNNYKLDNLQWTYIFKHEQKIRVHKLMINQLQNQLENIETKINDNEAKWSKDSGIGMHSVKRLIYGDFLEFLKTIFAQKQTQEDLQYQIYELNAKLKHGINANQKTIDTEIIRQQTIKEQRTIHFKYGHCTPLNKGALCSTY